MEEDEGGFEDWTGEDLRGGEGIEAELRGVRGGADIERRTRHRIGFVVEEPESFGFDDQAVDDALNDDGFVGEALAIRVGELGKDLGGGQLRGKGEFAVNRGRRILEAHAEGRVKEPVERIEVENPRGIRGQKIGAREFLDLAAEVLSCRATPEVQVLEEEVCE